MREEENLIAVDEARTLEGSTLTFEDPEWAPVIDELIKHSHRTKFIEEQIHSDVKTARLKDYIERRAMVLGIDLKRPRGRKSETRSECFLASSYEVNHSAYLLALHYGSSDPMACPSEGVSSYSVIRNLKKKLEVYKRYIQKHCHGDEAIISFEKYVLMLDAVKEGVIKFSTHENCGCRLPVLASSMKLRCYICEKKGDQLRKSREKLESIISNSIGEVRTPYKGSESIPA